VHKEYGHACPSFPLAVLRAGAERSQRLHGVGFVPHPPHPPVIHSPPPPPYHRVQNTTDTDELAAQELREPMAALLSCVAHVWGTSTYYGSKDMVGRLLAKVANQVINRCCAEVDAPSIFTGAAPAVSGSLNQVETPLFPFAGPLRCTSDHALRARSGVPPPICCFHSALPECLPFEGFWEEVGGGGFPPAEIRQCLRHTKMDWTQCNPELGLAPHVHSNWHGCCA